MNEDWVSALIDRLAAGRDAVLVTVAHTQGSAPREAGASMVVDGDSTALSIGGGHLEWQAIGEARRRLAEGRGRPECLRYNLGARLGQCCGGVVWLLFETVPAPSLADWRARQSTLRDGGGLIRRLNSNDDESSWCGGQVDEATAWMHGGQWSWEFEQRLRDVRFPVLLFGAGHVGRALVDQLRPLGAAITWVDSREDAFTDLATHGLRAVVSDAPEAEVADAPRGSYFLIMSHSHDLDFRLCEAVYARRDFAYFGLIGSQSKRASFEHRLLQRGLDRARLSELSCPIGIAGIDGKEPAVIALAVAAELLRIRQARQVLLRAGQPRRECHSDSPIFPE
jgi:xanthine dehydrogenase accessory factor